MIDENVDTILRKAESLESELNAFKSHWDLTAKYFKPQLDIFTQTPQSPDVTGFSGLYDTTGIESLDTYSNGMIAEVFSSNEKWMIYTPQDDHEVDDAGRKWYNKCSELALTALGRSNFYQSIKPVVTDMGCGGTGSLYVERGNKKLLKFCYDRLGTFAIEKDGEGDIRTEYRWLTMTASEMADKFGEDNLGKKAKASLNDMKKGGEKTQFTVIHACFPRNKNGIEAKNKPFASIYVCKEDRMILEEGGYDYYPFASPRAEIWNDYNYGLAPASKALPAMRELNKLRRDVHEGVALQVKPPWLVPSDSVDEISTRPNGVTVFDERNGMKPEQMRLYNDINAGMVLMENVTEQVRGFFHAQLFEAVAQKDKQMTAREVASIENAALRRFLPNFNQITTELTPIFQNVFLLMFNEGVFPDPPESVKLYPDGPMNAGIVPLPKVEFTSRIALAIRMIENNAIDRTIERIMPMIQIAPELADNFDLDQMLRDSARNDGISEDVIKNLQQVIEQREARAAEMAQQQQMMMAQQAASAAKDASQVDPEKLQGMMQ